MAGESPFMAVPPTHNQRGRKPTAAEQYDYDVARIRNVERRKPAFVVISASWSMVKPGESDGLLPFLQPHAKRDILIASPPELSGVRNHNVAQVAAFRGIRPQAGLRQYWKAGNTEGFAAGCVLARSTATRFPNCMIVSTKDLFTFSDRVWFRDGQTPLVPRRRSSKYAGCYDG